MKGGLVTKGWGTNRSQREIQSQEARRTNVGPQNTWCSFCVTVTTLFLTRNSGKMQLNDLKKKKSKLQKEPINLYTQKHTLTDAFI